MDIIELFLIVMSCWNETIWRVLEESDKLPLTLFDFMFFFYLLFMHCLILLKCLTICVP